MEKKINFGIIGMGFRGKYVGQLLYKNKYINLVAICDSDKKRTAPWENKNIKIYEDYKKLICDPEVEAVFIATPDNQHADIAIKAIHENKHVICEKPLEISKKKIYDIVNQVEKSNKIFLMGYVLRYDPMFKKIKEIVSSGEIGRIISVQASDNINYGGYAFFHDWHRQKAFVNSLLLQKASHTLDILNWIINSNPKKVAAFGGLDVFGTKGAKRVFGIPVKDTLRCSNCKLNEKCEESHNIARDIRGICWDEKWPDSCVYNSSIDVDDNQVIIIKYENGAKANYSLCQFTPEYKREYVFIGDKGKLVADDLSNTITITYRASKNVHIFKIDKGEGFEQGNIGMFEDFINCYYYNSKPIASIKDGANSVILAMAAQESIDKGEIVEVEVLK